MSAVDLDALIAELRTPIRVQYEEKPNHVLRRANVSRLNAAKALEALRRAPVSAGKVKAPPLHEVRALWCKHGGRVGGPRVETWSMPEASIPAFIAALQPGDGWQGIESAPRDGTWFLACIAEFGAASVRHVHFSDAYDRYPINAESKCWSRAPTHWMPLSALPAPPASLPQGEETR